MKFYQYINEQDIPSAAPDAKLTVEEIAKKCKPFIKNLTSKTIKRLLISGRKGKPDYFVGTVREGRTPRDTPQELHEYADDLFYEKFSIRARSNALFCKMSPIEVGEYGDPYIIFPAGKYRLIWSPEIGDLYGDVIEDMPSSPFYEDTTALEEAIETYKMTEKIPDGVLTSTEIMLHCKKYYALNFETFIKPVMNWLEDEYNAEFDFDTISYRKYIGNKK